MLISIKNFGPIREFECDLSKRINIIYGDNNIGKSYALQIIYLFQKYFGTNTGNQLFRYNNVRSSIYLSLGDDLFYTERPKTTIQFLTTFISGDADEKDISINVESMVNQYFCDLCLYPFYNACEATFGGFEQILNSDPQIEVVTDDDCLFHMNLKDRTFVSNKSAVKVILKKTESTKIATRNTGRKYFIYYSGDKANTERNILQYVRMCFHAAYKSLRTPSFQPYFFPASRSGFYAGMSSFAPIMAELSKKRALYSRKIELPGLTEPMADYYLWLSELRIRDSKDRKSIEAMIETDILHGEVNYDTSKNTLTYRPEGLSYDLDLSQVSSMVSELAPIVALLKSGVLSSTLKRNVVLKIEPSLFIEEPEAHLHPQSQTKLLKALVKLAASGVYLIMTSHSNYIFNQLNNLILSKELDYNTYGPVILERVGELSESRFMNVDELGVVDENFSYVSEALYNEREQILTEYDEE